MVSPSTSHDDGPGAAKESEDRQTVLIADDEPSMVRFLRSQIQRHYHVIEAADGLEAAQKAIENLPDIILLDMNMPEKDGMQVCRELREKLERYLSNGLLPDAGRPSFDGVPGARAAAHRSLPGARAAAVRR